MPREKSSPHRKSLPETQQLVKEMCPRDNYRTQNEFIEKAIRFYAGYVSGQDTTAYLPPALASVLRGTVQDTENRICRLLFKLAVEQDMVMNVLAAGMELPNEQFHAMRGRCVQDVKKPAAVSRWVTLSAIRGAVCDHPYPVQILRRKTKNAWMENYAKLQVRASSYKTYQGFVENHIKPALGDLPLEKLTSMDLQRLYKHLLESGRVECTESRSKPKGLSVKTVRNINQMISTTLNCAVEQRLIPSNPTKGCVLPKLERKEMKILPPESLGTFFEEARRSGVFELYYIDLATGLRRGELLGLKWSDIDLDKGIIHVRRQILRQNGEVVEAPLKTKNSYRSITIGADAIKVLKGMEQRDEYVFPSPYGGPMSPDSVLHMLQRVLKRAGLDRIRFHDLRHTFSVLALQNGVDVKTLSAMLGHYSAGFTLDTYAHVTTSMQKQAANAVGNFLSDTLQP